MQHKICTTSKYILDLHTYRRRRYKFSFERTSRTTIQIQIICTVYAVRCAVYGVRCIESEMCRYDNVNA